jgi:hypothetical protein
VIEQLNKNLGKKQTLRYTKETSHYWFIIISYIVRRVVFNEMHKNEVQHCDVPKISYTFKTTIEIC